MPALNWSVFENLPGDVRYNFEMLCRALVKRHYGRYGQFIARANQPGVEFHLILREDCSLGKAGHWLGWQCRWYDLPGGRALGATRRGKILAAIETTEKEFPELTDWILWTRRPLTKGDQEWYYGIQTSMQLHLWTSADVEEHLSGNAEIFRSTYFGELVLTPDTLDKLHKESVASIKNRWLPQVHQNVEAERTIRRMLGEGQEWSQLVDVTNRLKVGSHTIKEEICNINTSLVNKIEEFIEAIDIIVKNSLDVLTLLEKGDLDLLRQRLENNLYTTNKTFLSIPRQLRAIRHKSALTITNALADINLIKKLIKELNQYLGTRLVAVLSGAGGGKTHLAAQLSKNTSDRPPGILLHGRDLAADYNLNQLANRVVVNGNPIQSMEALIAAVDAVGQRAKRKLPIIIDGLNEAEDPRIWKHLLASINETLNRYSYILLICTVRHSTTHRNDLFSIHNDNGQTQESSFADQALPDNVKRLYMSDFGLDNVNAIRRYFEYYKIDAIDVELPIELLSHPLTLRIFCEVTNPKREKHVGIEAMPGSLTGLFEHYIDQTIQRVTELAPRTRPFHQQDVRKALDETGWALWEEKNRYIALQLIRKRIGDDLVLWNESIIRALEEDGILLREPGDQEADSYITCIYDALGGHLIARSIISRYGRNGIIEWIKSSSVLSAMIGDYNEKHPLSTDILNALVGLFPRRLNGQQLWSLVDEPLRLNTLSKAAELEAKYLDTATIGEIGNLIVQSHKESYNLFRRLFNTRSSPHHPLNTEFLDSNLRKMKLIERDILWTEWIRHNRKKLLEDCKRLANRWKIIFERTPSDILRARWLMWILTSTVRILRDQVTHTLYWFGRGNPQVLFDMTIKSLSINDPYVPERMLAASYGTAMALHGDPENKDFRENILPQFALELYNLMFRKKASCSTTHALMRDYSRHTIELALLYNPKLLKSNQRKRIIPPFSGGGIRRWGKHSGFGENLEFSFRGPLHMDFANYILGQLVPDRSNYDFDNKQYKMVVSNIYWRIVQLGYSPAIFERLDKEISSNQSLSRSEENATRIDRYGKKYSWIAYFELYGFRHDKGLLKDKYDEEDKRPSDINIDPSFPKEPHSIQVISEDFLGDRRWSVTSWIENGDQPNMLPYLLIDELDGVKGPWILLDGYLTQEDMRNKRRLFAFPRGLAISRKYSKEFLRDLSKQNIGGRKVPEIPSNYYTFAGEIPWCDTFSYNGKTDFVLRTKYKITKESNNELRFYRKGRKLKDDEEENLLEKIQKIINEGNDDKIEALLREEKVKYRIIPVWSKKRVPVNKSYSILIPVREYNWGSDHSGVNPGLHTIVPAREISEPFGLRLKPPSWNMYDKDGKLATVTIKYGNLWYSGYILCYLRKELLDQFLRKNRLDFLWTLWGQRELKLESWDRRDEFSKYKYSLKAFQRIYKYKSGQITMGKSSEYY